ncbi:MAG TPA: RidA family protein [Pirellulaceae bacterium]
MTPEEKFATLELQLPPAPKPIGLYRPIVVVGTLAYLSGHGPLLPDGKLITGRVGDGIEIETAQAAARQTGLALLATLRSHLGSLNRVKRLVKLLGMVQCVADFTQQPAVINGCSQLLADIWGPDHGIGARSAVGGYALPSDMMVEIEAIFELHAET